MATVVTVQKRGPVFVVVANSDTGGTTEDFGPPWTDKAAANAGADTLATAIKAEDVAGFESIITVKKLP